MKRPEVKLSNYEAVYDFYENHFSPVLAYQIGHRAMAAVFKPDVHFAPGVKDSIAHHLKNETRLILAANHVNNQDQYVVAAMAHRQKVMRPMRGNTFIPAKEPLFRNRLLRLGVDYMGAVPVFRQKDIIDNSQPGVIDLELRQMQKRAAQRLQEMSIQRVRYGDYMAIFPEGTRNTSDVTKVQPVKPGIAAIAVGLSDMPVAIMPFGIFYGQGNDFSKTRPTVYGGELIDTPLPQGQNLLDEVRHRLQAAVDKAIEIRSNN